MGKLVRDKIPSCIPPEKAHLFRFISVSESDYLQLLKDKLREEVDEFLEAENVEELADIFEVIDALIQAKQFDLKDIKQVQTQKRNDRGGFEKRLYMEKVD